MKVLITGAGGQLGRALAACAPADAQLTLATHADLDISDAEAVADRVRSVRPDVVINAAAYTAVDRAESEPDLARRINTDGPRYLAHAAAGCGARLLHVSTDFVFDGESSRPYRPESPAAPLNTYGRTKRDGEVAVLDELADRAVVLRTSWVHSAVGHNFVRTMVRLMNERRAVRVVADQVGAPTAAGSVAGVLWKLAQRDDIHGIHHWTDAGVASWYDFAVAIAEESAPLGLVPHDVTVEPIATSEYPTPARRPAYSVLDCDTLVRRGIAQRVHWRRNLRLVLGELARG